MVIDRLPLLREPVVLKCRDSLCEQARRLPRHFNTTPFKGVKPVYAENC